jgi:hypothetical protein
VNGEARPGRRPAPADIREEFDTWLDMHADLWGGTLTSDARFLREETRTGRRSPLMVGRVLDYLSVCTDPLPPRPCSMLNLPEGATYADAVPLVRGALPAV